jgi:hypothetical protein
MTEKEKREFYIATCRCCLIAQAMKGCFLCQFNLGLTEQTKPVEHTPAPISVQVTILAISEQC